MTEYLEVWEVVNLLKMGFTNGGDEEEVFLKRVGPRLEPCSFLCLW